MRAETHAGPYQRDIIRQLGCSRQDAAMVEDIMRRFIFHSTLDWPSRAALDRGIREAWAMLEAERKLFEEEFACRCRIFAGAKMEEAMG